MYKSNHQKHFTRIKTLNFLRIGRFSDFGHSVCWKFSVKLIDLVINHELISRVLSNSQ